MTISPTTHPLGYGAPMQASFALGVFYSGQDQTIPAFTTAPFNSAATMDPFAYEATMDPFNSTSVMDPFSSVGEM